MGESVSILPFVYLKDYEETIMALDMLGQKISEGDYVAYPGRSGSNLWVNISRVVGIETKAHWYTADNYDSLKVVNAKSRTGKISTVECLDRLIKLSPEAIESAKKNNLIEEEE